MPVTSYDNYASRKKQYPRGEFLGGIQGSYQGGGNSFQQKPLFQWNYPENRPTAPKSKRGSGYLGSLEGIRQNPTRTQSPSKKRRKYPTAPKSKRGSGILGSLEGFNEMGKQGAATRKRNNPANTPKKSTTPSSKEGLWDGLNSFYEKFKGNITSRFKGDVTLGPTTVTPRGQKQKQQQSHYNIDDLGLLDMGSVFGDKKTTPTTKIPFKRGDAGNLARGGGGGFSSSPPSITEKYRQKDTGDGTTTPIRKTNRRKVKKRSTRIRNNTRPTVGQQGGGGGTSASNLGNNMATRKTGVQTKTSTGDDSATGKSDSWWTKKQSVPNWGIVAGIGGSALAGGLLGSWLGGDKTKHDNRQYGNRYSYYY